MTSAISGTLLSAGGNTVATYQNTNASADRLSNGGTVVSFLKQVGGDYSTWDPSGPVYDGRIQVLDAANNVIKTVALAGDFSAPAGYSVSDVDVEALANGGFVVAWTTMEPVNWNNFTTHYAIYDNAGQMQTTGALSSTPGYNVKIAALANGGFATVMSASTGLHAQQWVVNTFSYSAGAYVQGAETYFGSATTAAPPGDGNTGRLYDAFAEHTIVGLSDGSFIVSAPTYSWVNSVYTPLGDFSYKLSAAGAQTNFASGAFWQRINWNPGQVNNAAVVTAFTGGYAVLDRGGNSKWQVTVYHNDGSLVTTTAQTAQVYNNGVTGPKTYYADDIANVVVPTGMDPSLLDQSVALVRSGANLLAVLPNAGGGFDFATISTTTGHLISLVDSGIAVPAGTALANPRYLADGSGFDLSYDVVEVNGNYLKSSTYQVGLSAPVNTAPVIEGISGDATHYTVGTPEYIDAAGAFADVHDADSAHFDGGNLRIVQTTGATDGGFSFDLDIAVSQVRWGSGAAPNLSNDGSVYTAAAALAVGDKIWYCESASTNPADWILVGTVAADGQAGHALQINFSNATSAIPSAAGSQSFVSLLLVYLKYASPSLGTSNFSVTVNDGDGATSTPSTFSMVGDSDHSATVTAAAGVSEPVNLPVLATSAGTAVSVFDFTIADGGSGDHLATRVKNITLATAGSGDFTKATWLLTGPDIAGSVTGAYNAGTNTIVFSNVGVSVADGGAETYTVKAYFNTTAGLATNTTYQLSIDGDSSLTLETALTSQTAPGQNAVDNGSGAVVVASAGVTSVAHATAGGATTNADSLSWTVTFSEPVSNVGAADFHAAGLTGETIVVASAGGNAYTVTASGGGLASFDGSVTLVLAAGQDIVNGSAVPLASLAPSGVDERGYLVDNTAPATPAAPDLAAASDSGGSNADDITSNTTPVLGGTAEAGATVTVYDTDGATVLGTQSADGSGNWSLTSSALSAGVHNITVKAVDGAGNVSAASAALAVTVDTGVAAPSLALAADTGVSGSDGLTANGVVNVTLAGDVASWEYRTSSSGNWSAGSGASFTLGAGSYASGDIAVRQTDVAGHVSAPASIASAVVVDASVPAPSFALADDTGDFNNDGFTSNGAINVSLAGDVASWEYRTSSSGNWSAGSGAGFTLDDGVYGAGEVQVRQTDNAGNTSIASVNAAAISVHGSAAAPTFALATDTGLSQSDGITYDGLVNVALSSDVASWEYRVGGSGNWTAGSGGNFTLADGSYAAGAIEVRQTDLAGNHSAAASNAATITVDRTVALPVLALANDTGVSGSDKLTNDGTIAITFASDVSSWEYRVTGSGGFSWTEGVGTSITLAEGSYAAGRVQVHQIDIAGNTSNFGVNAADIVVDRTVAAPALALGSDTGASASDGVTANGAINVTLAGDAASWEYRTSGSGAWHAGSGAGFTLGDGIYGAGDVQVRQTDNAGNTSTAGLNGAAITVDSSVAAPSLALAFDTGVSNSDGITSNGAVNVILAADVATWEYRTSSSGIWTAGSGAGFTLGAGSYAAGEVQVRQVDVAGNAGAAGSNAAAMTVDGTVATTSLALAADTGVSAVDGITNNGAIDVTLAADVATWEYRIGSGGSWTAGSGTSFTLGEGIYATGEVLVRQTDIAGNVSIAAANGAAIAVDTSAAAPSWALASDTGVSSSDGITSAGAVTVSLAGDAARWDYRTSSTGNWTAGSGTGFTLGAGSYAAGEVQVRQIDVAGNTSSVAANAGALTVDPVAPAADAIVRPALSHVGGADTFTVDVHYAAGGAALDASSIDVHDIDLTGPGALGVVGASYNAFTGTATYTVAAPVGGWGAQHSGSYAISMAAGEVRDLAGNSIAAQANAHAFDLLVNAIPVMTSGAASIDIVEQRTAVGVVSASDADAGDIVSYAITGGADQAKFTIGASDGKLAFGAAPDAHHPSDSDANNSYVVEVSALDSHGGVAARTITVNVLADLDRDGIADAIDNDMDNDGRANSLEDPVANAFGTGLGDGNGDGIADSAQINVASLATVGAAAAGKRFATLEVADSLTLADVGNSAAPAGLPRNVKMPLGQFDFAIHNVAVGGTAVISMYVDSSLGVNGYYKLDGSSWVNIGQASTVGTKTKVTFSITDGGKFDADGIANGSIVDPGGAALIGPRIISNGGEPAAVMSILENDSAVTSVAASAVGAVHYSISGGADGSLFQIDADTGALRFVAAPDYENPNDQGANNSYAVEVSATDSSGVDVQALTIQVLDRDERPPVADDGDSIPATTEQQVPALPASHGSAPVAGDGNGDGLADSAQANVTSVPFLHTDTAQSNPGTAAPAFVTLVADSVAGKADAGVEQHAVLRDVRQLDAPVDAPADLKMPLGQISFAASVAHAGGTEHFSLYVDGGLNINGYWKLDHAGDWVNLASAAYGGQVVVEGGKTRLDFSITDGGQFDDDGKADGVITDPGAPGFRAGSASDTDGDQFPDALEAANGLTVGAKDNDVFASNKLFVMELYRDLLLREGEGSGVAYWQQRLDAGVEGKNQLVSDFLDSSEFQAGVGGVTRLYLSALDRLPDNAGLDYFTGRVNAGAKLAVVADSFASSAEFQSKYGALDNAGFVGQMYQNVLGRSADTAGLDYWSGQLAAGVSRGDVLLGFSESAEFRQGSDHEVTVAMEFLGLLGRAPQPAEYAQAVAQLDAGVAETVVIGSVTSTTEFHGRFLA